MTQYAPQYQVPAYPSVGVTSLQQITIQPFQAQAYNQASEYRLVIFKNLTDTNKSKGFKQWEYAKRSTQTTTLDIFTQETEYHTHRNRSLGNAISNLGPKRLLHIQNYIRELNDAESNPNYHWVVASLRCNGKGRRNEIPDTMWSVCARVPQDAHFGYGLTNLPGQTGPGFLEDLSEGGIMRSHGIGMPLLQQSPPRPQPIPPQARQQILEAAMRQAMPALPAPPPPQPQSEQSRSALPAAPPPPSPPQARAVMQAVGNPPPPPPPPGQPHQMQARGIPPPPPPPPGHSQQPMQRMGGPGMSPPAPQHPGMAQPHTFGAPPPPPPPQQLARPGMPQQQAHGAPPPPPPPPPAQIQQNQASAKEEEMIAAALAENKRQQELLMHSIVKGLVPVEVLENEEAAEEEEEATKALKEIERKLRKFNLAPQQGRMPLLLRQSSNSDMESLSSCTTDSDSEYRPRTPKMQYNKPARTHKSSQKTHSSYDYEHADYDRAGYMRSSYDENLELEKKRRERAAKATRLSAVERNQWRSGYGAYGKFSMESTRQPEYARRSGRDLYNGSGYGAMDQRSEYSADSWEDVRYGSRRLGLTYR